MPAAASSSSVDLAGRATRAPRSRRRLVADPATRRGGRRMPAVIEVDGLRRRYGTVAAVDGISFQVQEREIFGIVGPNGAGKTTTVECLEGLRRPDGGRLRVLGLDPARDGRRLRQRIGAQLQQAALPNRLKVWEALDLYASFYRRARPWPE